VPDAPARELSRRAVEAAAAVARGHGLRFREPVLLHDLSNVLVHLSPAPVVARVSTSTGLVRPGDASLGRELALASHLAAAGAPAVRPSGEIDPGPHEQDGLVLSFWEYVEASPEPLDPHAAGAALRECHEALADFPGELPEWVALDEARRLLERIEADRGDGELLHDRLARVREEIAAAGLVSRRLHGDAHLRNVVNTATGPLWLDWEDAFAGPLEWDLACLLAHPRAFGEDERPARSALDGYGADPDGLDLLLEARGLQLALWALFVLPRHPELQPRVDAVLRWLRERA
jgi:Phosphotransferase enzyme family